jgi:hypothetical protein
MTQLLEHMLSKVADSIVINNPWPHIKIPDFLTNTEYHHLLDEHNAVDWDACWDPESSWKSCNLNDAYASSELFNALCNKFDIDTIEYKTTQKYKFDTPEHELQVPHRDRDLSAMTMQIFLQPRCYPDGGTVLMSGSNIESIVEELPLEANYCSIFLNTNQSWHMVKQRGYTRKSMVQRWIKV